MVLPVKATDLAVATRVAATAVNNNTKRVSPYPVYVSRWYVYAFWQSMRFTTYTLQAMPRLRKLHPPIGSSKQILIQIASSNLPIPHPNQSIPYANLDSNLLKILTIYGLDPLSPSLVHHLPVMFPLH